MKKRKIIISGILTFVSAAAWAYVNANKNNIIIQSGAAGFRTQSSLLQGVTIALAVLTAILVLAEAVRSSEGRRKQKKEAPAAPKEQKKTAPTLSVHGELDPEEIRQFLLEQSQGEWHMYRGNLSRCIGIMDQMQECRERLDTLLEMNGAETLRDTRDVLRQVQQYICRNMRKIINYLYAVDVDNPDTEPGVRQRFADCIADSTQKVDKVNEFIISLSDFLNTQGEDSSSLDMLDIYKGTILESIEST